MEHNLHVRWAHHIFLYAASSGFIFSDFILGWNDLSHIKRHFNVSVADENNLVAEFLKELISVILSPPSVVTCSALSATSSCHV